MFCTNCGKQVEDNSSFCTNCGAKLTPNAPAPTPVAEPVPAQIPVAEPVPAPTPVAEPVPAPTPVAEPAPAPTAFDPMTGQPVAAPAQKNSTFQPMINLFKKIKPVYYAIAGGVVALIIVLAIVINIITGSGIKGVLKNMEDAINDGDQSALEKCYPSFVLDEKDVDVSDIASIFSGYLGDVEVDFELVKEEDITDEDHDYMDCTWQEYIQDKYEDYDEYDGEEVEAVTKAKVKVDFDIDNDLVNYLADSLTNKTQEFTFVKVDGSWYIYD